MAYTWFFDTEYILTSRSYLQITFPLIVCACSSLLIILRAVFFARTKDGNNTSPSGRNDLDEPQLFATVGTVRTAKDGSGPGDIDRSKWFWPFRLCRFELIFTSKVSRSGRFLIAETSIEVCCLLGELVIQALALSVVEPRFRDPHTFPLVLSTIPWLYITGLLVLSISNQKLAKCNISLDAELSYHRATFYCLQGILTAARFRSIAIHRSSIATRTATSLDFALNMVLILNVLFASNRRLPLDGPLSSLTSSGELSSSIFSKATFTWVDALIWRRDTKDYEISNLWDLLPRDKSFFIMMGFQKHARAPKLMWKLIRDSRSNLLIQGIWATVSGLSTFLPTLLLKAILQYVEDPADKSSNNGSLFVILLFFAGCAKSVADGQASWMGRKIYIRLRAIIIGELYSKLLTRKASTLYAYELSEDDDQCSSANGTKVQHRSADRENGSPPGSGQIMTLMAVDSVKVGDLGASLHVLMTKAPIELLLGIIFLYRTLGYSSIAALSILGLLTPLRIGLARGFQKIQVEVMAATDVRVQSTNDVLQNIRLIKYFAWECRFIHRIDQARHLELQWLRRRFLFMMSASAIQSAAPILMAVLSFLSYTILEKKALMPSVAFASLSLFNLLRVPLDQLSDTLAKVQESAISINRVEKFLCQKSKDRPSQHVSEPDNDEEERDIGFHSATFSWSDHWDSGSFRLADISVQFQANSLNIIVGPTGSGKSSLLLALLGEMTLLSGSMYLPGSNKSEPLMFSPAVDRPSRVAYCSQQAWLRNDSIKNNIVFASPWNYERYQCVLEACCLLQDLHILPLSDNTIVGEKGVKLSGGQKQRVALARAVYSGAPSVLLDDCLSAVDSHTCKLIFERCIKGPLMHKRTCVLVTNNLALCATRSEFAVVMQDGQVYKQGRPEEVFSSGALSVSDDPNTSSSTLGRLKVSFNDSDSERNKPSSSRGSQTAHLSNDGAENDSRGNSDFVEKKAEGAVRLSLIQLYLSSMGAWYYWLGMLILFFAVQLGTVAKDMWIRKWANQHILAPGTRFEQQGIKDKTQLEVYSRFSSFTLSPAMATERSDAFSLQIFALLGLLSVGLKVARSGLQYTGSLSASKVLHHRLLVRILRAKFAFFDETPLGRVLNRFSKDIEAIDQGVVHVLFGFQGALFSVLTTWLVISAVTPAFLPPSLLIFLIYFCIGKIYIKSSRSLKRLEAVQRSPLYQHFDETLAGAITIRAYGAESRFMRESLESLDAHTRPWLYLWATNNWLTFRVEFVSACISFIVGALVIWNVKTVDPGAAGLSLTYAVSFTDHVLWLVRLYADTEIQMNWYIYEAEENGAFAD